ncbi:MAG: nitrilase-related carbon-nitrogen hydrolase [Planctomycetota bacterium]
MRVALVEFDTIWQEPAANRAAMAAHAPDADVAVYPELCFSGFTMNPAPDDAAEPFLAGLARQRGQALVAGYIGEGPQNVAACAGPDGSILARYAKLHPFAYAGEDAHYRRGDELPVFDLGGLRCAMLVCYDLRFPEAFRDATLRGAQAFFVIANWPLPRLAHWRALLVARAIENQAYVIGVNRIGRDPNAEYASSSMAVDPMGAVLHEGPGVVEIHGTRVDEVRAEFPFLDDIRTDRYFG